jgi:hypothetical protein
MKVGFIHEPELEFGTGRHIDVRFGLMNYGPLDINDSTAPKEIRVGIVGTSETVEGLVRWLEACKGEIPAKTSSQPNLFPRFPGFRSDNNWHASLVLDPKLQETIPQKEFEKLAITGKGEELVTTAASWFIDRFKYLDETYKVDVLICAAPMQLVPRIGDETSITPVEGAVDSVAEQHVLDFHNHLKAKAMSISKPIQIVLPMTYDESKRLKLKRNPAAVRKLQDEATRAWNMHTALYYKAKGIPWRLPRDSGQFTTCYVGVSFYESLDKTKLLTSVAEVFNQRGEGMVVRGGPAKLVKEDRQVHVDATVAHDLLSNALETYRTVHHNLPARLVIHKTSRFDDAEMDGFRSAAKKVGIHTLEMVNVHDSLIRLFRDGKYPPLRGTMMALDDKTATLYTRGSVEFFSTYPGMYVPLSLAFRLEDAEQTVRFHAQEILALTKMNWNNTQFDGFEPITIRAARQVGKILKYVGEHDPMQAHYSFYM